MDWHPFEYIYVCMSACKSVCILKLSELLKRYKECFATTVIPSVLLSTRYVYTHLSVHSLDEHKPALKRSICDQSAVYLCGLV